MTMFDEMQSFDQAFAQASEEGGLSGATKPLRLRKTLGQRVVFWGANMLVMPFVLMCYLTVSAEGLRQTMAIFSMRLYKLPIPGFGLMREYDGWDRLDLSMAMAFILFCTSALILTRTFIELMGGGTIVEQRTKNPVLFFLLSTVVGVILLGDCAIFYFGLEARASSGWSETPGYVPAIATAVYASGLCLAAAFHADYHCSGAV